MGGIFECKWGVCRKFESFVGNLGGFAPPPPPPEKVNFRHWWDLCDFHAKLSMTTITVCGVKDFHC